MIKIANIKPPDDMKNLYLSTMSAKDADGCGEALEIQPGVYYVFMQIAEMTARGCSAPLKARVEGSEDGKNFSLLLDLGAISVSSGPGLYGNAVIVDKRFVRLSWEIEGIGSFAFSAYLRWV